MCAPEVGLVSVPGRTVSNGLIHRSVWSIADSTLSWMFICSCLYLCLLHLYSHQPTVPLTVLLFGFVSVISVEALCDCADVGLPVHPDLSQNPLTLLQPLGSVQLWWCTHDTHTQKQNKQKKGLKHVNTSSIHITVKLEVRVTQRCPERWTVSLCTWRKHWE